MRACCSVCCSDSCHEAYITTHERLLRAHTQHPNFTQNSNFMHDGTTLIYFASEYVAPDQPTNSCAVPIGDVVYYSSQ